MELWTHLKDTKKPIVLYGMGNGADRIIDILTEMGVAVSGVFASDGFVRHQQFRGFTVCSYSELKEKFNDMIVLLAFGTQLPAVLANIKKIALEQELYVPDVPVVGENLFTEQFAKEHRKELERVFELLSDDQSKHVFKNIIKGKLTGKMEYLVSAESAPGEVWDLLDIKAGSSYMDLGAFVGDTILEFIEKNPCFGKIIAVEPDSKNYRKCVGNLQKFSNIQILQGCIDEKPGNRRFLMDGGRKSAALSSGGILVPALTIDGILQGEEISYIKMDVEGMERSAILGGRETIAKWKPKMMISAYHRTEDLFDLPLLIEKIASGSKIYLRHFPYLPAWDTNYYFNFE